MRTDQRGQWRKVFARILLSRLTSARWQKEHGVSLDMQKTNVCFREDFVRRAIDCDERIEDLVEDFKELSPTWQTNLTGKTYNEWKKYYGQNNKTSTPDA